MDSFRGFEDETAFTPAPEEEPAIEIRREDGTGETVLTAMGDAHVDVIVDRLKRKFGAAVKTATPRVPYRETIRQPARIDNK